MGSYDRQLSVFCFVPLYFAISLLRVFREGNKKKKRFGGTPPHLLWVVSFFKKKKKKKKSMFCEF